ncbi:MAG: hypothetical protein JSW00_04705 [Thermoplasmata archaeon]|nr:MAG: hypothetical protein JSW00_04705 [Thermoplasmata archaeon]
MKKGRAEAQKIPGAKKYIWNLEANHYVTFDGSQLFVEEFTDVTVPLMVLCGTGYVKREETEIGYIYIPNGDYRKFFADILPRALPSNPEKKL